MNRRNVIVIGGSRGLGLGIARKLTAVGYHVVAIARTRTDELSAAMSEAEHNHTGSLQFVPFDLAKIEDIAKLVRELRRELGPIYGLVNNAAVSFDGALAIMHNAQIEQLVRLNTLSPIVLSKYVVRFMLADGGGRIVNIASIIGFTGYSGLSVYGATKASMIGFTRSLAREVGPLGITVNAIAPGFIATEMTGGMKGRLGETILRRSPLGHLAEVDDIAESAAFLLGDGGRNITGTVLTIDAGSTA